MYGYLASEDCIRPKETEVLDHENRMETLIQYSDRLNGVADEIDKHAKKKLIYTSLSILHTS